MRTLPFLPFRSRLARTCVFSSFVSVLLCVVTDAGAAPPTNDTCAGAVTIPSTTFPYFTAVVPNMNESTLSAGDPAPTCIGGAVRNVWYRFIPNQTALYTFSTGADTATTAFDTILAIYPAAGGCGSVPAASEIACNDDSGAANNRAGLAQTLTNGVSYFIVVWLSQADDGNPLGNLALQLRVDRPQPPINDTCGNAELIPNSGFPRKSSTNETTLANSESIVPAPSCATPYRSVWYKFIAPSTNTYIFSTGPETATTVFDTVMVLYSSATSDCGALQEVTCSDNGEGRGSIFRTLNGGTTYFIMVADEFDPAIVSESLVQLSVAVPTVPTVTTGPLVSISSTGAVLNATVNPNGLQSRFWFEWGPTTSYGNVSSNRVLFPGTTAISSNLAVAGLSPNTTYHYRLVATNMLGRSEGLDQTFVWSTNRPTLGNPERLNSGNFRFTFTGNPRQVYYVESSTFSPFQPVVVWAPVGEAVESTITPGAFTFTHTGAGSEAKRYYRVKVP